MRRAWRRPAARTPPLLRKGCLAAELNEFLEENGVLLVHVLVNVEVTVVPALEREPLVELVEKSVRQSRSGFSQPPLGHSVADSIDVEQVWVIT